MTTPSPDEILRVHRHECSLRGHSWTSFIEVEGLEDPVRIVCGNCGRSCEVVASRPSALDRATTPTTEGAR